MEYDISIIIDSFGSLMGLPIRYYKNEELKHYISVIPLLKDPFELVKKDVFNQSNEIGYYIDNDDFYYCYLSMEDEKIIIGPTRSTPITTRISKLLAAKLNINTYEINTFVNQMSMLVQMPYKSIIESLSMLYYIKTGSKYDTSKIFKEETPILESNLNTEINKNFEIQHNSYQIEQNLLTIIKNGDVNELVEFSRNIPSFTPGILSLDNLRQTKNIFIVTATLASRTAIQSGLDINLSLSLSDFYIRKADSLTKEKDINNLSFQMINDYTQKIHDLNNCSPIAYKIKNYVLDHIDEFICLDDVANYLGKSKSNLCLIFKKENQMTLNTFINKIKIEKAITLYNENCSLINITYCLGYSSQSHFSNTFKKITGLSPLQYFKIHKK